MFFLITQKNHQTEFCFTLILQINNATVMKRLTEITVPTPSEVQLRIEQILKKFNGSCQQSHLLYTLYLCTLKHCQKPSDHMITNQRRLFLLCDLSTQSTVRQTEQTRSKSAQKLPHLYFDLAIKATHQLSSAHKILRDFINLSEI